MFSALLRSKLDRWFTRSPVEIEDLLTSLVFDVCRFHPPKDLVLPFLRQARSLDGCVLALPVEEEIEGVDYSFWDPRFGDSDDETAVVSAEAAGGEPELVLKLRTRGMPEIWILVEAKLWSGKSSRAGSGPLVTDQLGKYWVHLKRKACLAGAVPFAVVYLVRGISPPQKDFDETQAELSQKGHEPAPLYWLSWRAFTKVLGEGSLSPMLEDVRNLLVSKWGLASVQLQAWPVWPVDVSRSRPFRFQEIWKWPGRGTQMEPAWAFGWAWPTPRTAASWHFDEEEGEGT